MVGKKVIKKKTMSSRARSTPVDDIIEGGPLSGVLPTGTKMTIGFGGERLQAVQYCSVEIGPFSVEVLSREGETGEQLYTRGKAMVEEIAEREFEDKVKGHMERIRRTAVLAKRSARG